MFYRLFFLLCILSSGLTAQQSQNRLNLTLGSQQTFRESLAQKPNARISLEHTKMIGTRTAFFAGAGLSYGSLFSGKEGQMPDVIPGQFPLDFTVSTTYINRQLDGFLSLGLEYLAGNLRLRGALHPNLRLSSQIKATREQTFSQPDRPVSTSTVTVAPGEEFIWPDEAVQELQYSTPFQLQASLEADFKLTQGVALGLGYRHDLLDYTLTNQAVDFVNPPLCVPVACEFTPYEVERIDLRSWMGYLVLRVDF